MKKKQPTIYIMAAAFILLLGACSKQLNVYPTTSEVDGNVITDLQSAKTTLNGVYYRFANAGTDNNENPSVLWVLVNENFPSQLSGMFTYPNGGSELTDHIYQSTSSSIASVWQYGMNIVNAANGFLKNLEPVAAIAAEDKKEMAAEAKFLRAYANSILLAYYGQYDDPASAYGIVLRTAFVASGNISQARSSVKEAYDLILQDLDDAIDGLPEANTTNYYANVWAAKLLKARVLMLRNQLADKPTVINLCQDIIDKSTYRLEAGKDLFWNKGLESNEVILGVKPYTQDVFKFSNYLYYNQVTGTDLMLELFKGDPRASWVMAPLDNPRTKEKMQVITKYFAGNAANPAATVNTNVSYAFRLTEAYLLEAEALTESGGDLNKAKNLLKTVMAKSGVTDFSAIDQAHTAEALQLQVIKEQMRNFVGEAGQDWFALRRLPFATIQKWAPTIKAKELLVLPIPQDEMKRNSGLKGMQNPGYGGQ